MIIKPFNQRVINPAVVGMVLAVLSAFVLFLYQSGLAEAQDPPANNEATGNPTISGTAQVDKTLAADTSGIADADGLSGATFSYQWVTNSGTADTDITDATDSTYTLVAADEGMTIKVRVSFTDDAGNEETLTSAATVAVEVSTNHPAEGWLSLSGMAEVGQAMHVVGVGIGYNWGIRDEDGLTNATYNFQWIRSDGITDVDILDATDTSHALHSRITLSYTLADADEGKYIKVRVSFTDDAGNAETLTSSSTTAVTARPSVSDLGAPSALTVGWSEGEEKGLDLSWTAPEGTVTSYQILRLEIPTRSRWWEPYPYGCTPLMEVHVSDTGGGATAYTDTDVAEGASYTYSVRVLNSDGVGRKSASPGSLQYRPPHTPTGSYWPSGVPGTLYRVPTNLASSQIKNGIGLTWDAPEGEVTGYQILRRSPEQCDYGYRVYVENTNSTDTHWADRNVAAGTRYEYHVRAINDVGPGRLDRSISTSLRPTTLVVGPEPNNSATGTPTITGTPQVGETLTADPSGIADADGMLWASLSYQWLSSRDTEIEGATSPTYKLQASDANKAIKVRVDFMDDAGYEESLTSAATVAVSPNVSATGAPAITGTVEVGETLTADTSGISDTDGLDNVSFSYQWIHSDGTDDLDVDGATGATYAVTATDVDKAIKLRVNFTDDKGSVESLTSPATSVVPIEVTFTFNIDGTTVTCDSYNIQPANIPIEECDDPTSTEQGASGEIGVGIEIARSVNSQLYKFDFRIYQMTDSLGNDNSVEANDLCLGPGLADSVSMEVTPDDGTGNFTYTDEGTILNLCPAGTYQMLVFWDRYNYEDQEYESAWTWTSRRYFFINGDDEEDTSIEQVKFIKAQYPDPPVSHDEVQIEGTKQSTRLNRELTTFALSIDGLVPDSDPETTDYVVRLQVIGSDSEGRRRAVPWCHVGDVGYSYLLKTVPEDGRWEMDAHVLGNCLDHWWPDTLRIELFDGTDLTDYSTPVVFDGSNIISPTGGLLYPESGTHEFIAGTDISLDALPNSPATGAPTITGTAQVGETLTASTTGITDTDGLTKVSYAYQWLADDTDIAGATSTSYTLTDSDQGKAIKVRASFTDDAGNEEALTSEALVVPVRPHGLTAVVSDGAVVLTWNPPVGFQYLYDYQILRNRPDLGETDPIVYVDTGTAETTYTDTDVEPGALYVYRVKAANYFNRLSQASEPVQIRTPQSVPPANSPATGAPTISGTAQVGETLTANTSGIADEDGLTNATFSYQWLADDADISGATNASYTLTDSDEGKTVKVTVTLTDDAGNEESVTSAATDAVASPPTTLTASIRDAPERHDGENSFTFELRFSETPEPDFSYEALRDHAFTATGGTVTNARRIEPPGNVRWEITVEPSSDADVTIVLPETTDCDDQGAICTADGRMLSAEVALTVAGPEEEEEQTPPENNQATGVPTISGEAQVGETLTASTSDIADADGLDDVSFSYQWLAGGTDIDGATGSSYSLTSSEQGETIQVRVTFSDDADNQETLTSEATEEVAAKPDPLTVSVTAAAPATHDGSSEFTFEIEFSEEFDLGYVTLRDHAFTVTGGSVKKAQRTDKPSNIPWRITVKPDGTGDVTIKLPATTDCDAQGAICTGDGRMLSNSLNFTVSGPGQ